MEITQYYYEDSAGIHRVTFSEYRNYLKPDTMLKTDSFDTPKTKVSIMLARLKECYIEAGRLDALAMKIHDEAEQIKVDLFKILNQQQ